MREGREELLACACLAGEDDARTRASGAGDRRERAHEPRRPARDADLFLRAEHLVADVELGLGSLVLPERGGALFHLAERAEEGLAVGGRRPVDESGAERDERVTRDLADRLVDELADRAWAMREIPLPSLFSPEAAIDEVRRSVWRRLGPITLIDADDIVGAGAPGGNTHIVRALVGGGRGLAGFVPVHDPALVEELWDVPSGTRRQVVLRGTPGYGMPEVPLDATVKGRAKTDYGWLVRLDVDTHRIVVSNRGPLPIHPSFWEAVGLSVRDADLVVQKNFFHYRMFHLTASFRHLPVVSVPYTPTAAVGATSLGRIRDQAYPIPMAPHATLADWRPYDPLLRAPRSTSTARAEHPA